MKKIILSIASVIIIVVAYWLISPLFKKTELNEAVPISKDAKNIESSNMKSPTITSVSATSAAPITVSASVTSSASIANTIPVAIKNISGNFVDGAHVVSGVAKVINADGANTLRFENFSTENGPDLFVYLATDNSGKDFVNLGKLKATNGNFNYNIPANVNVEKYNNVLIWCRAFGVLFGSAEMR